MNILRLKDILHEKRVSGKELALKLGVSQNTISNIVNGYNFPKPALLLAIAEELDVDIRELFISTRAIDINTPEEALKQIKKIIEQVEQT